MDRKKVEGENLEHVGLFSTGIERFKKLLRVQVGKIEMKGRPLVYLTKGSFHDHDRVLQADTTPASHFASSSK